MDGTVTPATATPKSTPPGVHYIPQQPATYMQLPVTVRIQATHDPGYKWPDEDPIGDWEWERPAVVSRTVTLERPCACRPHRRWA